MSIEKPIYPSAAAALPIPAGEPVLTLYDTLGPGHADGHALAREVWRLEAEGCPRIHLRINSAGGSVAQGYSLFAALRHTRMEVHTWADGLALSMAGLLFLAGRHRHMAPWSMLMLHNPSLTAEGEAEDAGNALILERVRQSVLKMYADVTALSDGKLATMMQAETWLTASEALALGLATDLAGQAPQPALEQTLRAQAQAGVEALQATLLQARPAPEATGAQPPAAPAEGVGTLLAQLAALEAQLTALERRLAVPSAAVASAYTPLPQATARANGQPERTFRQWERHNPQWLARLQAEDPARFEALYHACYGQKGGAR